MDDQGRIRGNPICALPVTRLKKGYAITDEMGSGAKELTRDFFVTFWFDFLRVPDRRTCDFSDLRSKCLQQEYHHGKAIGVSRLGACARRDQ